MSARKPVRTNAARLDALESDISRMTAALEALARAAAPVAAPAKPKAASPAPANEFVTFLREKAAAKVACDIHAPEACNRRFSPASSGRTGHVARIEA